MPMVPSIKWAIRPLMKRGINQITASDSPAPPVNVSAPVVTGAVYVGQTLSTTNGGWSGYPAPTFTYQWKRDGSDIGGATAATYLATLTDEGREITCAVTADNGIGSPVTATSNTLHHWVPSDFGFQLWLDARDASTVTIATGVSQWNDKSGNANNFTQATGSLQPSYTSGQRITFDGSDDRLQGTQILAVEHAIFVASNNRTTNTDINTSILSQDGGSNPDFWYTHRNTGLVNVQSLNTAGGTNATTSVIAPTSADMVTAVQKPSTAGLGVTAVNGTRTTNAAPANDGAQLGTRLVIGTQKLTAGRFFGGDVIEILISASRMSLQDWQLTEGYLAWRNGTVASLASGHPWKSTPPVPVPVVLSQSSISGSPYSSNTLTVNPGTWANPVTSYSYQWRRNGVDISGATASTYVCQIADDGAGIDCSVVAIGPGGTSAPNVSPTLHGWIPSDEASIHLWYDPTDASTITQATGISQINDKSGRGRNATQPTGANQPEWRNWINGRAAMVGYGDRHMTMPAAADLNGVNGVTVGSVQTLWATPTGPNTFVFISRNGSAGSSRHVFRATATNFIAVGGRRLDTDGFQEVPFTSTNPINTPFIGAGQADYSAAQAKVSLNGATAVTGAFQTAGSTSATDTFGSGLMAQPGGADRMNGALGEVVVFAVASDTIQQKLEGYLAHRWGLTSLLDSGHPYKTAFPTP